MIALFLALNLFCANDGARVQTLYLYQVNNQLAANQSAIQGYLAGVDKIFVDSAAKTGGYRHVRFVADSNCQPTIEPLQIVNWTWMSIINEAEAAGYNRSDRKYLMFLDGGFDYCGISTMASDDTPGASNVNNYGDSFSAIKKNCWSDAIPAHELAHQLGAVQRSAPHSDGDSHCTDGWDLMCSYSGMGISNTVCGVEYARLLDCNHDDYFNANPAPGSYLDTHWNAANSVYLQKEFRAFMPMVIR